MDAKRWTLGVVLAATVGLWGLMEADASPFASYILSDDLGNVVSGTAPSASEWKDDSPGDIGSDGNTTAGSNDNSNDGSGANSGGGTDTTTTTDDTSGGKSNNGHGNNADGVDSSNPGQGKGGPNGTVDTSCPEGGTCVDDEIKTTGKKK